MTIYLYQHIDGRAVVAPAGHPMLDGDPGWVRQFPVEVAEAWQPIEIAPTDGTVVLVYPPTWGGRSCASARYDSDEFAKKPRPFWRRDDAMGITQSRDIPPTHWMPLPQGPGDSNG